MSSITAEFNAGATPCTCPPLVLNNAPPVKSPIKDKDFSGAYPEPWTSSSNIANPPTNREKDFKNPNGEEFIPVKASISGMV